MRIISAMQRRYGSDAYVLMFEVGNSTGFACNRHADALAVGLWPSKGIEIIGFEFKESRSDWLRELKEPAKAESIYRYCHRWYLVVSDAAILKHGELPKTWGQLTLQKDGKLKESVKAPKLEPTPQLVEEIIAYRQDHDLKATADRFNTHQQTITKICREAGFMQRRNTTKEERIAIFEYRLAGHSLKETSAKFGRNVPLVSTICSEMRAKMKAGVR